VTDHGHKYSNSLDESSRHNTLQDKGNERVPPYVTKRKTLLPMNRPHAWAGHPSHMQRSSSNPQQRHVVGELALASHCLSSLRSSGGVRATRQLRD
jgi:hypothetical protein